MYYHDRCTSLSQSPANLCRGQAYDGVANIAGHLNGLAVCLQFQEHRMLYVHMYGTPFESMSLRL